MSTLFLKVMDMSISASWLILVVLILRFVLRKAPKWVYVLLWGIVAVKLICPFTIESSVSLIPDVIGDDKIASKWVERYIEDADIHHYGSVYGDAAMGVGGASIANTEGDDVVVTKHDQPGELTPINYTVIPIMATIWLIGIGALLIYIAISYGRLRRKVDTAILYRGNIFQSENVVSPFVLGFIKPRIYLPFKLEAQVLEHVVAHEQAHIQRRDHWWKLIGFLLLTLHWFNPFTWTAYRLLCRDIELACDEKVIKKLENKQRADYTEALAICSVNHYRIAACPLAFGEVGVKDRIKSIMNYKKPSFWLIAMALLSCIIVAVCFLTHPRQDSFTINITVPAGSQEDFVYSDTEISPTRNKITVSAGDHLGDTEVILKPIEVRQENAYDEATYLTPGISIKLDAEKGGWFKIGVNMQNPTGEDKVVSVKVDHVAVRTSDYTVNPSTMGAELTNGFIESVKRDHAVSDIERVDTPVDIGEGTIMNLRIVEGAERGELVLAGKGKGHVYTLNLKNEAANIYLDGKKADASALKDGMMVEVSYKGALGEIFPAPLGKGVSIFAYSLGTEKNPGGSFYDLCGLYLKVLEDLWEKDSGLNGGATCVSIDLSNAPGELTEGEKDAITWIFACVHQVQGLNLSFEELKNQGYLTQLATNEDVNQPASYEWKEGICFSITGDKQIVRDAYSVPILKFNAKKWRSPLGAYSLSDCTAIWSELGTWKDYSIGAELIS